MAYASSIHSGAIRARVCHTAHNSNAKFFPYPMENKLLKSLALAGALLILFITIDALLPEGILVFFMDILDSADQAAAKLW